MDERARVPFALVGVLLLVGSATLTATVGTRAPATPDPSVDRAIDRATATAGTALRRAVARAGRRAAEAPVIAPANTSAGRVLNASTPFEDYLRLRIYLAARARLRGIEQRVGDVRASAALAPTPNASALRRAKRRVRVEPAGPNRTALRVRIENVTVTARRGERVVGRTRYTPTLVVATPALALHERTSRFERRLNRGPLAAGLGREVTGRLYAIAWGRGYAQYGGAPIANVVANRHVELATNGALLAVQRSSFGRSDPDGRRAMRWAAGKVAAADLFAGAGVEGGPWAEAVLDAAGNRSAPPERIPTVVDREPSPSPRAGMRVGVNRSADAALVGFVDAGLEDVLASVYSAEVRLTARVRRPDGEPDGPDPPPGDWTLVDERTRTTVTVRPAPVGAPRPTPGWHVLRAYGRRVERTHTTTRRWRRGNETRVATATETATYRVDLAVVGRHARSRHAPGRPIAAVHEAGGGRLAGPNLAGVQQRAVARLVTARGGPDALAQRAVAGTLRTDTRTIPGERPDGLRAWVRRDLVRLRDRVRNVAVRVPRGALGTYRANPSALLATEVRERRTRLVDAPERYASVAEKARVAARAAYLERVLAALEASAARRTRTRQRLNATLAGASPVSLSSVARITNARRAVRPDRRPPSGPGGRLVTRVDGRPPYLTLAAVDHRHLPTASRAPFHPLVARNLNVFTTPYGDAADAVVAGLFDARRVHLRTAARTLLAARRLPADDHGRLARRRRALRGAVEASVRRVEARVRAALRREGIGTDAGRRAAVRAGLAGWPTPAARALALANGSAADALTAAVVRAYPRAVRRQGGREVLRSRIRTSVVAALRTDAARPPQRPVNRTATTAQRAARRAFEEGLAAGLENASERARRRIRGPLGALPAGFPVAPVPGYWYATVNLWRVDVRGAYARFTLRARRGAPGAGPASVAYTRDGSPVVLDVDGDGRRELLGRATRVSFETWTVVVVVVPPGGAGVGDTDGDADERSAGWPRPGTAP